jgi:S-adenosylmethionine decarboxylase
LKWKWNKVLFMQGLHLTADLHHCCCEPAWLLDAHALGAACADAVQAVGLQSVGQLFHAFPATGHGPGGVTATVLLAESHLCVHTWPEQMAVTLDVYVCNFGGDHSGKAHTLMNTLIYLFDPARVERHALTRGAIVQEPTDAVATAA